MISTYSTNFIGSDGVDLGSKLLTKERFNEYYLNISNQYITPELWIWGAGSNGKNGTNDAVNRSTPVTTFAGGANWKQISYGTGNLAPTVAGIKNDGTLWIWGRGGSGELGDNTTITKSTPVTTFAGGTNWKQVACGYRHMAAIKTDGTLWVWGFNNASGALGINDTTGSSIFRSTPITTFAGGNNWKQVSVFGSGVSAYNAAIKTDGTLWTWGTATYGVLGIALAAINICTPVTTFTGGNDWKQVSCGYNHVSAIKTDGSLWVWGRNHLGQLGNDGSTGTIIFPVSYSQTNIDTNWRQVSCGQHHTAAIKTDGTLWLWGSNDNGQLGDNTTIQRSTPVTTFAGGNNWKQVSCTSNFTTAIKTDGTLWVWGDNILCNLGINDTRDRSTPVTTFIGGNSWRSCSSSMAIRSYED